MDALSALWLTSIVGAAGFTATGYFLARSGILGGAAEPASPAGGGNAPAASLAGSPSVARAAPPPASPAASAAEPQGGVVTTVIELPAPAASAAAESTNVAVPSAGSSPPAPNVTKEEVRPSPRRDPRREESEARLPIAPESKPAPSQAPPRGPGRPDHEAQLAALHTALRTEVLERDREGRYAKELAARLSAMTEQVAALRVRVSEEAQVARTLRDSLQAAQAQSRTSSILPSAAADAARARLSSRAPGLFAEIEELKGTVARLGAENASLREMVPGGGPPLRVLHPRLEPQALERVVARIARLDNVRGAAVAESDGILLVGAGELAEPLAAFSAYLKDAASRSDRLLPLHGAQDVVVRDASGLVFSTQLLARDGDLSLVVLATGDVPSRHIDEILSQESTA